MLNWTGFNPETQRAYVNKDGMPVIEPVPAEILAFRQLDTDNGRLEAALAFIAKNKGGFPIDKAIDVEMNSAAGVMARRRAFGYTWVPSMLMPNVQIAPGLGQPGASPYDPGAAAPGSILVPPF